MAKPFSINYDTQQDAYNKDAIATITKNNLNDDTCSQGIETCFTVNLEK
jgi:hypothetical protein